jgi:demethylspheroidene O-methyltransferase
MSWPAVWIRARNRLLASRRFQQAAARWPVGRTLARRHARALFDLSAGFVYSQVAAALVESGLFAALRDGPLTIDEAAAKVGLPPDAATRLLRAAAPLGLTETSGGRWHLGPRGAMLAGTPGIVEMIAHHRYLYADLADPLAVLRGERHGELAALWDYGDAANPAAVASYSALMAASLPMVAEQAFAAYPIARHRRLLDVGGGLGRFITAAAVAAPEVELGLLDRPAVIADAEPQLAAAGLGRVALHPGDFTVDPLPRGYDLITLVRVLHDHDDAVAQRLLRAAADALEPGGRLLIVEPMAGTRGARSVETYFTLYLAAMRSGRPRTPREIGEMLGSAGFRRWQRRPTPLPLVAGVILAER